MKRTNALAGLVLLFTGASAVAQSGPMMAACRQFEALRDKELGKPTAVQPRPLDFANGRELFRRAEAYGFSGGLLLKQGRQVRIAEGYGMADRARGVPITPETIFDIGSVAKQFTGAAILRLEEMGRLKVEDPISRHLPGVPADKRTITIHHLLTHTGGFPHDVGDFSSRPSRDDAVQQMLAAKLNSKPGEKHAYSNTGYAMLAAIIETASDRSYEAFMREHLWLPLGMRSTGMVLGGLANAPVAEGYFFDGPLPANIFLDDRRDGPNWLVRGAGYIVSTLHDMERWGDALRTGRVLTGASRRKLFWPHVRETDQKPSYYGYGWALFSNADGTCRIGHDGSAAVHYDFLNFYPDRNAMVIAYSTQQRAPWRYFPNQLFGALNGKPLPVPDAAPRRRSDLQQLAGDYRLPDGGTLVIGLQDDRLFVDSRDPEVLRLFSPWPLLPQSRTAPLGDRQALISEVMEGIARGDYAPLLSRLRKTEDPAAERKWWQERWPQWVAKHGAYTDARLVGTVEMDKTVRSIALLRFAHGAVAVGFVHDHDGRIYIDWMPQHLSPEIFLAPQRDGNFLSWHPASKRTVKVRFDERSAVIDNGQERAVAVRASGTVSRR